MDFAVEDIFADLCGQPQSSGVTSFLRHCIEDDDTCNEVTSDNAMASGLDIAITDSLPKPDGVTHLSFDNELTTKCLEQGFFHEAGLKTTEMENGASAQGQAAILGAQGISTCTETQTPMSTTSGYAETVIMTRKRGRKPKPRLPDLQQRLHALNEQFEQLSKENIFLRDKLKVLERVVPYRDESVGFLTQLHSSATHMHVVHMAGLQTNSAVPLAAARTARGALPLLTPQKGPKLSPAASEETDNSLGSGLSTAMTGLSSEAQSSHMQDSRSNTDGEPGAGASYTSNAAAGIAVFASLMATDFAGLSRIASASSQQHGWQQNMQQLDRHAGNATPYGAPTVLGLCPAPDGEVPAITPAALEELKRITSQQFCMLWKHICLQLGVLVTGAEVHGPGSSPYVRLERFLERALSYMDKITLLSPACFVQSMYMNVETGQPERPSDNFWITCARALKLSAQQLKEVNSLAAVYEQNVVPVVQQRLQLSMQLASRLSAGTGSQRGNSRDALTALSAVDELAEKLERNVLKEHQTHSNIGDFLCSSVLTPLQVAKALTVCYPYIPDGVAMLHAFTLISSKEDAQAAAIETAACAGPTGAPQLAPSNQPFPSLAGLLASRMPAILAVLAAGGVQGQGSGGPGSPQQVASGAANVMAAALGKLVGSLPLAQLQQVSTTALQQQQQMQQQAQLLQALTASMQQQQQAQLLGQVLAMGRHQQRQQPQHPQSVQLQSMLAFLKSTGLAARVLTQSAPESVAKVATLMTPNAVPAPSVGLPVGAAAVVG
ncbi:hypothetical protein Vretimale_10689 [Volvox reticuliferus]|uniref:Uncharacterized protein n=1 Tax=Volvox reticuliferus TaxID=1737510 RepID=A0A8J4FUZ6_9CHLO|nr:hypothetical protein Vretifemale_13822 [Volvox reticuliferus]GIM06384.1 hypothetical protein Vretimale_10689 [Volvox reticuliferus]